MVEFDECFGEVGYDMFGVVVEFWWDGFVKWCDLGNLYGCFFVLIYGCDGVDVDFV